MKSMQKRIVSPLFTATIALTLIACPFAQALAQDAKADEIMALAKTQWAAENAMKPTAEAWTNVAADYTEFNSDLLTRVDGKAMAAKFYDASNQSGDVGLVSEMQNPKVQIYGDTAILTYNYAGMTKSADNKVHTNVAKSTRVYVKQSGRWMLVHANFAPAVNPAN